MYHVLYNPNAGNGNGEESARKISAFYDETLTDFMDMTKIKSYAEWFKQIPEDDKVVVCGGDGTLNRFVNDISGIDIPQDILYFAAGSGNDFLKDLGKEPGVEPFSVKKYFEHLPTVEVAGKTSLFINNMGFGIDGYCCEVGDQMREKSDKPINYTSIVIKGLLGGFKPANARVTVDGKTYEFKKCWLAPAMNGRFYGGGMMPTPEQDRLNPEHTVSLMVFYGIGKLKALMVFPSIFKGEHVKHSEMVRILTGRDITVEFDRPCSAQIDGETVLNVTEYHVKAAE